MDQPSDRLYNIKELAAFLGLNERTIKFHQKKQDFPRVKLGRSVRYNIQEVLAWYKQYNKGEIKDE